MNTVYCVVPVHNRLRTTQRFVEQIAGQSYSAIKIVIVDDGSTDGTAEYLAQLGQSNLKVLKGDGTLWWGGAMRAAMDYLLGIARDDDYLLMLNDDVEIRADYVERLVEMSAQHRDAIVGSAARDEITGGELGCAFKISYWAMRILPVGNNAEAVEALAGRGVLFPFKVIQDCGVINSRLFPHYLGDLEYTARAHERGWKLVVAEAAPVFTSAVGSDAKVRNQGLVSRYLSSRSKNQIFSRLLFFSVRGPLFLRITAVPRYLFIAGISLIQLFLSPRSRASS